MPNVTVRRCALRAAAALVSVFGLAAAAHAADPVVFTFASVGDSRQDPAAPDPTTLLPNNTGTLLAEDAIWLQNSKAFTRILRSVTTQKPQLLFFNGDMIYGYERPVVPTFSITNGSNPAAWAGTSSTTVSADFLTTYIQYAYWRGMVANLMDTGTYVVPVPGNHETQCNYKKYPYNVTHNTACSTAGATAYVENENAYRVNMGDLINDLVTNQRFSAVSGVTASNVTGLTQATAPAASTNNGPITTSQAQLTYSFDVQTTGGKLHFAIVNTDPAGADGTAPADWLAADLAAAQSRGAVKFFVFGHKPAFTYQYGGHGTVGAAGLDATSVNNTNPIATRNAFWSVIVHYGATYFCGHEHVINVAKYADPTGTYAGTGTQVIVGTGGSPFDDTLIGTCPSCSEPSPLANPSDRFYGWSQVQVHASGTVQLNVFGFNDAYGPTQTLSYYSTNL